MSKQQVKPTKKPNVFATKLAKKKANSNEDSFIPDDVVSGGSANYLQINKGDDEHKIRIISKPVTGWIEWVDKKPVRTSIDEEPEGEDEDNKPKKFLTVAVIDRNDGDRVKIMEVTQQSVIKAIKALTQNPDWGNPHTYDINITRTGQDLKTRYSVTPSPKKALDKNAIKIANATPCYLDNLFEGADPWNTEDGATEYFLK